MLSYLSIYGYQLTPDSRIHVSTHSGVRYTLEMVHQGNIHRVIQGGKRRIMEEMDNLPNGKKEINVYEPTEDPDDQDDPTLIEFDNPLSKQLVVVGSNVYDKIGSFGFPIKGIRIGETMYLGGRFGLTSSPVKSIQAYGMEPDRITAQTISLLQNHYKDIYVEIFKSRLARKRRKLSDVMYIPPIKAFDPLSIRTKVSALIMALIDDIENQGKTYMTEDEIDTMSTILIPFVTYQCFYSSVAVCHFQKVFSAQAMTGQSAKYEMEVGFRSDDYQITQFSLTKQTPSIWDLIQRKLTFF